LLVVENDRLIETARILKDALDRKTREYNEVKMEIGRLREEIGVQNKLIGGDGVGGTELGGCGRKEKQELLALIGEQAAEIKRLKAKNKKLKEKDDMRLEGSEKFNLTDLKSSREDFNNLHADNHLANSPDTILEEIYPADEDVKIEAEPTVEKKKKKKSKVTKVKEDNEEMAPVLPTPVVANPKPTVKSTEEKKKTKKESTAATSTTTTTQSSIPKSDPKPLKKSLKK